MPDREGGGLCTDGIYVLRPTPDGEDGDLFTDGVYVRSRYLVTHTEPRGNDRRESTLLLEMGTKFSFPSALDLQQGRLDANPTPFQHGDPRWMAFYIEVFLLLFSA